MTATEPRTHGFILAGGYGSRFWPLSREMSPKQLLSIFGTESLIAQAVRRVLTIVGDARSVHVVTGERLVDELRNNLCANEDERFRSVGFLVEPVGRNTAPAIALAAATLARTDPEGVMIVVPSDHVLDGGETWVDTIECAISLARDGYLTTVGLTPTRAETGYGYVEMGDRLPEYDRGVAQAHSVSSFVEKPDAETARGYVEGARHLWNGGMFVMRADVVLRELRAHGRGEAEIADTAEWVASLPETEWMKTPVLERFGALPAVPIDTAVMERSSRVAVIPAALEWSDVGSFLALGALAEPDGHGNVRVGRGVDVDSSGCIVYSSDRLVATLGLENAVVVDTSDATLVCPKDRCQDVRRVADALRDAGAGEVTESTESLRPWGSWTSLLSGERFRIKRIEVAPGKKLSLQRHERRSEHWVVVAGTARVTRERDAFALEENESAFIPAGTAHRLENPEDVPLVVIEVQVGEYIGEDDIVRLDDDWGRTVGSGT